MYHKAMQRAFSLVELSIVLVILGLLIGGILSGQSLIRASELRAVSTESQRYAAAVQTFRDKYFAVPGDMPNATSFWGAAHVTPATCRSTVGTGTQTCDGNGDGRPLNAGSGGAVVDEEYRFWQHLANAGLIEGSYTGVDTGSYVTTSLNSPKSRLNNAYWFTYSWGNLVGTGLFDGSYGNALAVGAVASGVGWVSSPIFRPEELWNIDTKMDDGMPGLGKVVAYANGALNTCTSTNSGATTNATYLLTSSSITCMAIFRNAY